MLTMEKLMFGLQVGLLGLLVTFVALFSLYFILELFKKIFPQAKQGQIDQESILVNSPVLTKEAGDEAELAAVMSVVLSSYVQGPIGQIKITKLN